MMKERGLATDKGSVAKNWFTTKYSISFKMKLHFILYMRIFLRQSLDYLDKLRTVGAVFPFERKEIANE